MTRFVCKAKSVTDRQSISKLELKLILAPLLLLLCSAIIQPRHKLEKRPGMSRVSLKTKMQSNQQGQVHSGHLGLVVVSENQMTQNRAFNHSMPNDCRSANLLRLNAPIWSTLPHLYVHDRGVATAGDRGCALPCPPTSK